MAKEVKLCECGAPIMYWRVKCIRCEVNKKEEEK